MIPSRRMPRTFEGRLLPRPEEPAYDQGLHFDLATLMSRRRALHLLGLGAGVIGLAACSSTASDGAASTGASTEATLGQIPDETAGPFPGNGSNGPDVLSEQGVVRSDIRSSFGTSAATAAGGPDDPGTDRPGPGGRGGRPGRGGGLRVAL